MDSVSVEAYRLVDAGVNIRVPEKVVQETLIGAVVVSYGDGMVQVSREDDLWLIEVVGRARVSTA